MIAFSIALLALAAPPDAASAFARLKTLAGSWEAKTDRGAAIRIDYRLVSNGSVLMQSFQPGTDRETITASARGNYDSSVRYIAHGFRVARDLD